MAVATSRKHQTGKTPVKGPATSAAEFFKAKLAYETTPHALKRDLETGGVVLLDVRDADAFKAERIPGAKSVPLNELESRLSELPKGKILVTYCWNLTCAAAPKAALILAEKGFKVQELVGGIEEFRKKFPTERAQ